MVRKSQEVSTVSVVPTEILTAIFLEAHVTIKRYSHPFTTSAGTKTGKRSRLQDFKTSHPLISFSHVCQNWRCAVLQSSFLWSHIWVLYNTSIRVLDLYLGRAQDSDLHITYSLADMNGQEILLERVLGQVSRCASLVFHNLDNARVGHVLKALGPAKAPRLVDLCITKLMRSGALSLPQTNLFNGCDAPLRRLRFAQLHFSAVVPPFVAVQSLNLAGVTIERTHIESLFREATRLRVLELQTVTLFPPTPPTLNSDAAAASCNALRKLVVKDCSEALLVCLAMTISAPNLEYLALCRVSSEAVKAILAPRVGGVLQQYENLKRLELADIMSTKPWPSRYAEVAYATARITQLNIVGYSKRNNMLLTYLAEGGEEGSVVWPKLTTIRLTDCDHSLLLNTVGVRKEAGRPFIKLLLERDGWTGEPELADLRALIRVKLRSRDELTGAKTQGYEIVPSDIW